MITIGCDPELLIIDNNTGKPRPAWTITKGTKNNHHILYGAKTINEVRIHADNVALEFNIRPAATSIDFRHLCSAALERIEMLLAKTNCNYTLSASNDEWTLEDLLHPIARTIGCDPDFDAYSEIEGEARPALDIHKFGNARFFGGHVHLGFDKTTIPDWAMVRLLDAFIGLRLIALGESQGKRRIFYGLPGLYRPKPYGIEYRTPSSFWLSRTQTVGATALALAHAAKKKPKELSAIFKDIPWDAVQAFIRDENAKESAKLWQELYLVFNETFADKINA